jgi:ligand-binding sensor domain-containing protein
MTVKLLQLFLNMTINSNRPSEKRFGETHTLNMKQMKPTTLLLGLLLFGCTSGEGQNQANVPQNNARPRIANYSEAQLTEADTSRVPMSMVRRVRQAQNGDILVASYLSVFRHDGTAFANISREISLTRSSSFWDVLEDRNGNIWFATRDSGAYCYPSASHRADGQSLQHFTTREGLANNRVMTMYEDKAGNIWFGTGGGVSRYDGKSFRNFTTKEGLSNNDLTTIMEDKTGKLWFGTRGEACYYDGKTFTVFRNEEGKAFNNVWSIFEDTKGNIWFGDAEGLWRHSPSGNTFTNVSPKGAYAIIQDQKGNLWTTGADEPPRTGQRWSLSRYDAKSLYSNKPTVTEIRSQTGMLLGIVEDAKGNIWFGSSFGVHRYDGKTITDFKRKEENK